MPELHGIGIGRRVAVGPVLLALTNGLVKIYRDSVVFPLRCR